MASYFTSSQYASHLPDAIASDSDIDNLAATAEAKIIAHYRRRVPDTRGTVQANVFAVESGLETLSDVSGTTRVYLLYYEADADDVDTTDSDELAFLNTMRRAIAEQVKTEYWKRDQNPTLRSITRGERSETYATRTNRSGISSEAVDLLAPFDIRPVTYAI